jgi:hypothetical protein
MNFIRYRGRMVNLAEVLWTRNVPASDIIGQPAGLHIEFIRKGSLFIEDGIEDEFVELIGTLPHATVNS